MKTLISILHVFSSILLISSVSAQPTDVSKLKKLSFVLRGTAPTIKEYEDFSLKIKTANANTVLEQKVDEYLNSYYFSLKFSNKVADLLRIDQTPFEYSDVVDYEKYKGNLETPIGAFYTDFSTFHLLVREIIEKNLPWSELLNQKSYMVMYQTNSSGSFLSSLAFYSELFPKFLEYDILDLESLSSSAKENYNAHSYTAIRIELPKNEKRVAGVLTTPSFLSRYASTGVNKNRRRAAAIFRTFLCKDMVAAIPVAKDGVDENKKLALVGEGEYTESDLVNHAQMSQIHGQKAECLQCHKQLDPMGNLFNQTPTRLGPRATAGALAYYNDSGEFVNKPIAGIGDLGAILTSEKDYLACQVKHFWKWVHGENSLLNPKQELELIQTFKRLEQKPKDFVKHLLMKKEFFSPPSYSEKQLAAVSAYKTLKKCQSCHNQQSDNVEVQDLNWYQLIGQKQDVNRADWIKRVTAETNKGKMPPKDAKKDFSELEMIRLKKWLDQGAPDFEGN